MLVESPVPWAGFLFWLCAATAAQAAGSEDELALAYGDQATVSIATGRAQPLRRAPAVATVITAQDIAAMGVTDLDRVLESVPGMHVGRTGTNTDFPLYVIRGIYSIFNAQTLMLQNGVPMTTLFVGNRGNIWAGLPVDNIERIEVIRGPGSALYGADAYAGVINIITRSGPQTPGTEYGLRAGSFGTSDAWVQHGGALGPVQVAAYLRAGHSDGPHETIRADAQTHLDELFGTHASLAPGTTDTRYDALDGGLDLSGGNLRMHAGYKLRDDVGPGIGVAGALDPVGRTRSERLHADLSWTDIDIAQDLRAGMTASAFQYIQRIPGPLQVFPPGAFGGAFPDGMFGAPETWERQFRLSAFANYGGWAGHDLRLGVGADDLDLYRTREFKNFTFITSGPLTGLPTPTPGGQVVEFPVQDSFLTPHRRKVEYSYLQDEWQVTNDWTVTGGIRRDHFSDFGDTTNPRLAVVWDAAYDLTAKLLYGRAFRAPAYTELYSVNNPVARGNPQLRPETIRTLEAALAWQPRAETQVNLSVFSSRLGNIIRLADGGNGTLAWANTGTQRGRGFELVAIQDLGRDLRIQGQYSYQRSIDERDGQDAGYAPHGHLYARVDWTFSPGWFAGAQADHVGGRARAAGDARPPVADYDTLDLVLRRSAARGGWQLTATVHNLFGADVREPSLAPGTSLPDDLPQPRRSVMLEAVLRL